jgi:hypothetical protein
MHTMLGLLGAAWTDKPAAPPIKPNSKKAVKRAEDIARLPQELDATGALYPAMAVKVRLDQEQASQGRSGGRCDPD